MKMTALESKLFLFLFHKTLIELQQAQLEKTVQLRLYNQSSSNFNIINISFYLDKNHIKFLHYSVQLGKFSVYHTG